MSERKISFFSLITKRYDRRVRLWWLNFLRLPIGQERGGISDHSSSTARQIWPDVWLVSLVTILIHKGVKI